MTNNQSVQGKIYIRTGTYAGAALPVEDGLVIGSDPEQCQLIINDPDVERKHCRITYDEKKNLYYIETYSISGVLKADGSVINQGYPVAMQPGEQIRIGKNEMEF